MKYGPTSAATSAMMKAIARPSSVVCTESPLEGAPAQTAPRELGAGAAQYIETSVAKSQRDERRGAPGSDQLKRFRAKHAPDLSRRWLPACGQTLQAAQHEGRPPFRIYRVIEPQVGQPAQQGRQRDLRLDARQLGTEAEVNAAAKRQRPDVGPGDVETLGMIRIDRRVVI